MKHCKLINYYTTILEENEADENIKEIISYSGRNCEMHL